MTGFPDTVTALFVRAMRLREKKKNKKKKTKKKQKKNKKKTTFFCFKYIIKKVF